MKFRDHPKMEYNGFPNWPPQWAGSYGPGTRFPIKENGVLRRVQLVGPDKIGPARLRLIIEHDGGEHNGALLFDDPSFLHQVYEKLKQCLGHPVCKIGSQETDF